MKARTMLILMAAISLVLLCSGIIFAQESKGASQQPQVPGVSESTPVATDADLQWLWGEIVAVNSQNKEMKVKYIDYETDSEKEVVIYADAKTTFENVESLDAIKPQDGVSIDYIINSEGKYIAKNVSLEKAENMEETGEVILKETVETPAPPEVSTTSTTEVSSDSPEEK